jgi:hypothetical protein
LHLCALTNRHQKLSKMKEHHTLLVATKTAGS